MVGGRDSHRLYYTITKLRRGGAGERGRSSGGLGTSAAASRSRTTAQFVPGGTVRAIDCPGSQRRGGARGRQGGGAQVPSAPKCTFREMGCQVLALIALLALNFHAGESSPQVRRRLGGALADPMESRRVASRRPTCALATLPSRTSRTRRVSHCRGVAWITCRAIVMVAPLFFSDWKKCSAAIAFVYWLTSLPQGEGDRKDRSYPVSPYATIACQRSQENRERVGFLLRILFVAFGCVYHSLYKVHFPRFNTRIKFHLHKYDKVGCESRFETILLCNALAGTSYIYFLFTFVIHIIFMSYF
jgi:hypothetical protein